MHFKDLINLFENKYLNAYKVTGKFIFTSPFGTTAKHIPVNMNVRAYTPKQAALVASKKIAKDNNFKNSYIVPNTGYKVIELPKKHIQTEFPF
jgi:hypothetical protein